MCIKCEYCRQTDIKIYQGHPNGAVNENIALIDPKLHLFRDEIFFTHESGQYPKTKLTCFSVYDKKHHLCAFNTGLIEEKVQLYFSGYIKSIYEEDASPEGGVPAKDMGPINRWYTSRFDEKKKLIHVIFITNSCEYILMDPSEEYAPFMDVLKEKIFISKCIIEFLLDEINLRYEDLINKLQTIVLPKGIAKLSENSLLKHARFICHQVSLFNNSTSAIDLTNSPCMRTLLNFASTATQLVKNIFGNIKLIQKIDFKYVSLKIVSLHMYLIYLQTRFSTKTKLQIKIFYFVFCLVNVVQRNLSKTKKTKNKTKEASKNIFKEFEKDIVWVGDQITSDNVKTFYGSVIIGDEEIKLNDYVLVELKSQAIPSYVAKVIYMWENTSGIKQFHANWLYRGNDTILKEISDPTELFLSYDCDDVPLKAVRSKCTVIFKDVSKNWAELCNTNLNFETEMKDPDDKTFFYQKRYIPELVRFEDPLPDLKCFHKKNSHKFCSACAHLWTVEQFNLPKPELKDNVDEDMYPEYYKKFFCNNVKVHDPFCIGYINQIYAITNDVLISPYDIFIKVNKLYRSENTHKNCTLVEQADINMVYWSDDVYDIEFLKVIEKCYLTYSGNLNQTVEEWSAEGPNRFYFNEAYNAEKEMFYKPPYHATCIGIYKKCIYKNEENLKFKDEKTVENEKILFASRPTEYNKISKRLKTLDVFAGCGGLSEGLHQSGVAETLWAIEKEKPLANAFLLNNANTTVFTEDCNILLKKVMNGEIVNEIDQKFPQKGQVELLCGGLPYQGFSIMNIFNSKKCTDLKNSLIVTYLSYCDYYRPNFFIMENVRNFVYFKNSIILKLTLQCLIRMGYQCTFGVLQAGSYGVPQNRQRVIILAAAPGQILPKYPKPIHTFYDRNMRLWFDNKQIRGKQLLLRDHISTKMALLDEARIAYIPINGNWLDLPNIVVKLRDGTYTNKLKYTHDDKRYGRSTTGAYRGVCRCCMRKKCNPRDKQAKTLIPWSTVHTKVPVSSSTLSRLQWNGYFATTTTRIASVQWQGRVFHPVQNRLATVREWARSQGFSDSYRFYGSIRQKQIQIGNAVPPPLALAIGLELRKCIKNENVITETSIKIEPIEQS
ncbi:DNA (cytosine-5)-methyltransferase 1 [Melipona quadrifasciata]|uniref:DNA (cytosine-5-)-methyltransferase n=1 Tax=Melipona quadrifasciata TaxID=166423 RepID=A0A0N0BGE4_9HYME|nr:DNA (cytosine-5)-methyltransferase 1 [Melipona quadrifasciata]